MTRTDPLARELLELGSATVYEAARQECYLPAVLRPAWPGARVAGPALPVRTAPADNLPLHLVLEIAEEGKVLVADACGIPCGYWGEVLTVAAQQRAVAGLVIDGGVRDTVQLAELGFPVFSSAIAIRGTAKTDSGSIGEPIEIGGVRVARHDMVVADADGVVVIPVARVDEVLAASRERQAKEQNYLRRIKDGELTLDIYGFRAAAQG